MTAEHILDRSAVFGNVDVQGTPTLSGTTIFGSVELERFWAA